MSLVLVQTHPDPRQLATWAIRHGLSAGGGDLGYALHTLLAAAFGDAAPKPFRHFDDARGLLGYSTRDAESLQFAAQTAAPDVAAALGLDRFATRTFPDLWGNGRRLAFELRVRPILRTREGRERDVFLAEVDKCGKSDGHLTREEVYLPWLAKELGRGDAATVEYATLESFRLSASLRKGERHEGLRPARRVSGPDAMFKGELTIKDSVAFASLVARGVGRHRAFGFGMLLLRPPAVC